LKQQIVLIFKYDYPFSTPAENAITLCSAGSLFFVVCQRDNHIFKCFTSDKNVFTYLSELCMQHESFAGEFHIIAFVFQREQTYNFA